MANVEMENVEAQLVHVWCVCISESENDNSWKQCIDNSLQYYSHTD